MTCSTLRTPALQPLYRSPLLQKIAAIAAALFPQHSLLPVTVSPSTSPPNLPPKLPPDLPPILLPERRLKPSLPARHTRTWNVHTLSPSSTQSNIRPHHQTITSLLMSLPTARRSRNLRPAIPPPQSTSPNPPQPFPILHNPNATQTQTTPSLVLTLLSIPFGFLHASLTE